MMEGLRFEKLNEYQTLVMSENHQIVLTNVVAKYTKILNRAIVNAVISMILAAASFIFTIVLVCRSVSYFQGVIDVMVIVGCVCVTALSLCVFSSSRWDISRFSRFINAYHK